MQRVAMLTQLGYAPNDALLSQLERIEKNTSGYEKIQKHIMDLHDHLKVDNSWTEHTLRTKTLKRFIEALQNNEIMI